MKKLLKNVATKKFLRNIQKFNIKNKLFINGEFVESVSKKTFQVINPFTEKPLIEVSEANETDVNIAVDAAEKAFEEWKNLGTYGRQNLLLKLADLWDEHSNELGELESLNNGNYIFYKGTPISQQMGVVKGLADEIRYHAGWCTKALDGRAVSVDGVFDVKVLR